MNQPEMMALDTADGKEHYTALVHVTPNAVVFNLGFTFQFNRDSVRQVCERLLTLLGTHRDDCPASNVKGATHDFCTCPRPKP